MAKSSNTLTALRFLDDLGKQPAAAVCVLFGDQAFLKRQVLAQLRASVLSGEESEFSCTTFVGDKSLEPRPVLDELATRAMFGSDRRLVVVENADAFVANHRAALEDYVAQPRANAVLVLMVDSWPAITRLYKAVAAGGLPIDCNAPKESELTVWLKRWAKQTHHATLNADAADRLVEIVGPEMGRLDQELAKLALLAGADSGSGRQPQITVELVDEAVGGWRAKQAWDMIDAAAEGNAREALAQLDRLLRSGEVAISLLAQISSSLRRFAAATRMIEQAEAAGKRLAVRQAVQNAASKPLWPAALEKSERQLRQIGRIRGKQLYGWLLDADLALKGVSSKEDRARLVLEQLLVRLSSQLAPQMPTTTGRPRA